jgi:hypothetical protein
MLAWPWSRPAEPVVARVNTENITVAEFSASLPYDLDSGRTGDSIRQVVLDYLVDRHLFLQEAKARGIDRELAGQVEGLRRSTLVRKLYDTTTAPAGRLTAADMQAAYDLLKTEVHVRLIAVRTESAATLVQAELASGIGFESLAVRRSVHPSSSRGGDLGFIPLLSIDDPLRTRVRGLAPAGVCGPVLLEGMWQFLQLLESRPSEPPPFDSAFAAQFVAGLKQQRRRELVAAYMARTKARITYRSSGIAALGKQPSALTTEDKTLPVAVIDGTREVRVSDLLSGADRWPVDPEPRRQSVERAVEELVLYGDALAMRLDGLPDVVGKLARRSDDLLHDALYKREVTERVSVSEEEIVTYFEQNKEKLFKPELEHARPYITNLLTADKKRERNAAFIAELRARAKITVNQRVLRSVFKSTSRESATGLLSR